MADEHHKSFWTTLPGLLTGIASLTTAMVALMTFMSAQRANNNKPAENQVDDISHCREIVGDWAWFTGGVAKIGEDGSLMWKYDAANTIPPVGGQWTCIGPKKHHTFTLSWAHGLTDTVMLSPDGKSLAGTNLTGARVSATRRA